MTILGMLIGLTPISASGDSAGRDLVPGGGGPVGRPAMIMELIPTGDPRVDGAFAVMHNVTVTQFNAVMVADEARNAWCNSVRRTLDEGLPPLKDAVEGARREVGLLMERLTKKRTDIAEARAEWNRLAKVTRETSRKILGITLSSSRCDEIPSYEGGREDNRTMEVLVDSTPGLLKILEEAQGAIVSFTTRMTDNIVKINSQRGEMLSVDDVRRLHDAAAKIAGAACEAGLQPRLPAPHVSSLPAQLT